MYVYKNFVVCSEMPCKLKFNQPKNYERKKVKKLSYIISIRLQDVTVLPLSIPRQLM